jgi:hypothetical protein
LINAPRASEEECKIEDQHQQETKEAKEKVRT